MPPGTRLPDGRRKSTVDNMRLRFFMEVAVRISVAFRALVVTTLIPLGACSSDDSSEPIPADSTTVTSGAAAPTTTPVTILAEVDSVGLADLPDGVHYGLITAVDPEDHTLSFDKADLVEGGTPAMQPVDGISDPKGAAPDLSRMVNDDDTTFEVSYAPDMEVYAINWGQSLDSFEASTESFLDEFVHGDPKVDPLMTHPYLGARSSYWILIENGEITRIVEQA